MMKIGEYTYCDACGALATHSVFDSVETPAAPGEWREFRQTAKRSGCDDHPAVGMCSYLDGRVLRIAECKPERVPLSSSDENKSATERGSM